MQEQPIYGTINTILFQISLDNIRLKLRDTFHKS